MEKSFVCEQTLAFMRLHDTARSLTSPFTDVTHPSFILDAILYIFEALEGSENLGTIKFHLRTLYLQHLCHKASGAIILNDLVKIALTCAFFLFQNTLNTHALLKLVQLTQTSEYEGYFETEQHAILMNQVGPMGELTLQTTTPYQFATLVVSGQVRKFLTQIIDLAITIPEVQNATAEEIFLGSFMLMSQFKNSMPLSDFMTFKFGPSIEGGNKVMSQLQANLEADEEE